MERFGVFFFAISLSLQTSRPEILSLRPPTSSAAPAPQVASQAQPLRLFADISSGVAGLAGRGGRAVFATAQTWARASPPPSPVSAAPYKGSSQCRPEMDARRIGQPPRTTFPDRTCETQPAVARQMAADYIPRQAARHLAKDGGGKQSRTTCSEAPSETLPPAAWAKGPRLLFPARRARRRRRPAEGGPTREAPDVRHERRPPPAR